MTTDSGHADLLDTIADAIADCERGYYRQVHPRGAALTVLAAIRENYRLIPKGALWIEYQGWILNGELLDPQP